MNAQDQNEHALDAQIRGYCKNLPSYARRVTASILFYYLTNLVLKKTVSKAEMMDKLWGEALAVEFKKSFNITLDQQERSIRANEFYLNHGHIVGQVISLAIKVFSQKAEPILSCDSSTSDEVNKAIAAIYFELYATIVSC
ncbi:hypothetical protein OAO01_05930 [Oligoflexia bacterium]|nr:hypothetical protein [Oligoflexia bacterium]